MKTQNHIQIVLDEYSTFLKQKQIADSVHRPYFVRWVKEFLLFAHDKNGYTFEQIKDLFSEGNRTEAQHSAMADKAASDALKIYYYQYRSVSSNTESIKNNLSSKSELLDRLREIIRIRHYSPSTEKTYLHWVKALSALPK